MVYRSTEDMPLVLNVEDIADTLMIGRNKAYNLVNSEGFPSIRIGRKILVPKDEFEKWVKTYLYHEYIL